MKNRNEKGFALVLSLVLLLVMSLMGGALIVISSGDHQSNNSSDEYQQAFYIAEHALLEAEKSLVNKMMGPMLDTNPPSRNEDIRQSYIDRIVGSVNLEKYYYLAKIGNYKNNHKDSLWVEYWKNGKKYILNIY